MAEPTFTYYTKEQVCDLLNVKMSWLVPRLAKDPDDPDWFPHIRLQNRKGIRIRPVDLEEFERRREAAMHRDRDSEVRNA